MAKLAPLDDPATYRKVADAAYARDAIRNPKAVLAGQEAEAEGSAKDLAAAPATAIPGVKFTKGFTPAERAVQAKALAAKLKARDAATENQE